MGGYLQRGGRQRICHGLYPATDNIIRHVTVDIVVTTITPAVVDSGRRTLVILHALIERKRPEALGARVPFLAGVRPDVLGQAVSPGERLGAQMALERFFARMGSRVLDQLVPSQECFVAHLTHVVLGREVDFLVVDQPHLDLERLAAHIAHERLVRVVGLPVYVYGTVAGTGVTAHVALEQRFLLMGALVRRESQFGRVRVAAQVAHERLLAGVYAHVGHQCRVAGRRQAAVRAREHAAVLAHVSAQRVLGLAPHVAHVAAERLLRVERVLVDLKPAVRQEQFPARGAAELFGHVVVGGTVVIEQVAEPGIGDVAEFARVRLRLEPPVVLAILCSLVLERIELFNFTFGGDRVHVILVFVSNSVVVHRFAA